jgi:hypothetical protein
MSGIEANAAIDSRFQRSFAEQLFLAAASLHEAAPLALNTYMSAETEAASATVIDLCHAYRVISKPPLQKER